MSDDPARPSPSRLECRGLALALRPFRLGIDLSCELWPLVILGPSGAGKSVFLRILAGLPRAEEGRIEFTSAAGSEIWSDAGSCVPAWRRGIGYCQQEPALFPHRNVVENVEYPLANARPPLSRRDRRERALEELRFWGAESLAQARTTEISGGEQARVALARTLVSAPRLLLLDEPFSSLDPPTREELTAKVAETLRRKGVPAIWVTHDRDEAMTLGRTLAVFLGGRVAQIGSPEEVFRMPASPEVASFVGVGSVLHGFVQARGSGVMRILCQGITLRAAGGVPPGTAVVVLIRSEDVEISRSDAALSGVSAGFSGQPGRPVETLRSSTSVRNEISARVVAVRPQGLTMVVDLDAGVPLAASVTRPAAEELELHPGLPVIARIKAVAVQVRTEEWEAG